MAGKDKATFIPIDDASIVLLKNSRKAGGEDSDRPLKYKFVLAYKGVKIYAARIYTLSRQKAEKESIEKMHELELKKECTKNRIAGIQVASGKIVSGSNEITFQLDQTKYARPPVQEIILRDFVQNIAGVQKKAEFQLVNPTEMQDDSGDEGEDGDGVKYNSKTGYLRRRNLLEPDVRELIDSTSDKLLYRHMMNAQLSAKSKKFVRAHKFLDKAELVIEELRAPSRFNWKSVVRELKNAEKSVKAQLNTYTSTIRSFGNEVGDDEIVEIANSKSINLTAKTARMHLINAVKEVDAARDEKARLGGLGRIMSILNGFRKYLAGSRRVKFMDRNHFGIGTEIAKTYTQAFTRMEKEIRKARV